MLATWLLYLYFVNTLMDFAFHIGWYSMNLLWYKLLQKDFLQSPTCVEKTVYIIYNYTDRHPHLPLFQIKCTMVSILYLYTSCHMENWFKVCSKHGNFISSKSVSSDIKSTKVINRPSTSTCTVEHETMLPFFNTALVILKWTRGLVCNCVNTLPSLIFRLHPGFVACSTEKRGEPGTFAHKIKIPQFSEWTGSISHNVQLPICSTLSLYDSHSQ